MSRVTREECHALARLARLSLDEREAAQFSEQLEQILTTIEQLQSVDVEGVPEYLPPAQPGSALRPDVAGPMLTRDQALAAAPAKRAGQVVVPKFKED